MEKRLEERNEGRDEKTKRAEERNERQDEKRGENIHNINTKKPQEKHTPPQRHKNEKMKNTSSRATDEDDEEFMNM